MYKVKYTGNGGFQMERDRANKVFVVGQEYEVVGGTIYSWVSEFVIDGIKGTWNTTLFDTGSDNFHTWDCMEHDYLHDSE